MCLFRSIFVLCTLCFVVYQVESTKYQVQLSGVGRGTTGRLFSLLGGRAFEFGTVRFTLLRGVEFTFTAAFAFGRFALTALFELTFALFAFALALPFSFSFLFLGRLGLFSLRFDDAFVLRFSLGSSGVTFSGVSPSLAGRLMSIATV